MLDEQEIFWQRPVIGFVVEGKGEFYGYQTLCARILGEPVFIRCQLGDGYGGVVKNLERLLRDLVGTAKPHHVIVTLDLSDAIKGGITDSCLTLITQIHDACSGWLTAHAGSDRYEPLPRSITCVLQVPKLESWLISDREALSAMGYQLTEYPEELWLDIDNNVENPATLAQKICPDLKLKRPGTACLLFSNSDPNRMTACSRSFRKFEKEVRRAFDEWCQVRDALHA